MEAFNNSLIPADWTYIDKDNNQISRDEIQKKCDFETKTKKIVPQIFEKSFARDFGHKYKLIKRMKKVRDNIIHSNSYKSNFPDCSRPLYIDLVDFDLENIIYYVRDYINYYKPDWIVPCDCGADH